jgi:SAM-dependent methyltransferase
MGLNINTWNLVQNTIHSYGRKMSSSKICLLGNLYLYRGTEKIQKEYGTRIVQKCFEQDGAVVVSIDINGKDGALPFDLEKPLPTSLGQFDVIINGGTTEHIKKQHECFKNIHDICKIDGLMFHTVPLIGSWTKHGYYAYSQDFFKDLALRSQYAIVDLYEDDYITKVFKGPQGPYNLVCACLRKEYDASFGGLTSKLLQRTKLWPKR